MPKLIAFSLVGLVGFFVDSGVLLFLSEVLEWPRALGRLISMPPAVLVTFALNRRLTFKVKPTGHGFFLYFGVQVVGAFINYFGFVYLVGFSFFDGATGSVLALLIATVFSFSLNFFLSSTLVFRKIN